MAMTVPNPYAANVAVGSRAETGLVSAPGMTPIANDQAERLNENQKRFKVAMQKYQDEVDKTRVMDMSNKLHDLTMDLQSGEQGYEKLMGINALERPDNRSLVDEMEERYKQGAAEIIKSAGNARQREMIERISNSMRVGLKEQVNGWVTRQFKDYSQAVYIDSLGKAGEMAQSTDENTSRSGFYTLRNLVKAKAAQDGVPPDYRKVIGPFHVDKVAGIIDNVGAEAGREYLRANKGEMTADQIASVSKVIEAKKDSENVSGLAQNIIAKGLSEKEALKLTDNLGDKYKDKVRRLVKDSYAEAERARSDRVDEIEDMFWNAFNKWQPIPSDAQAELMELDPKKYHQLFDGNGVFLEFGKAPSVSDESVVRQLEKLRDDDIEAFATTDLRRFGSSLTKQDMTRFTNLQEKSGDESYKAFKKELAFRIAAEGMRQTEKTKLLAAADRMWDEAKQRNKQGAIDEASRKEMVKALFAGAGGWCNTKGYEAILENLDMNVSQAMYAEGVYGNADIKGRADSLLKRLGKKGWKDASEVQRRTASSLATGAGWPTDVMDAARKELEEIKARKRARGERIPDEFDGYALELIMMRNVFGK